MNDFPNFVNKISNATEKRNNVLLSQLLTIPFHDNKHFNIAMINRMRNLNITAVITSQVSDSTLANSIIFTLQGFIQLFEKDFVSAYKTFQNAFTTMLEYYNTKDENRDWVISALVRFANNYRIVSMMADSDANDTDCKNLRDSINTLVLGFKAAVQDRKPITQPGSKKHSIFGITNVLFKIYFKVNTLHLCRGLISAIEGPGNIMSNLQSFNLCDVTMYKYYIGRLKMFEDKYEEARSCLRFALTNTPINHIKNRQRILVSLVPIEMVLGILPSPDIGRVYGLHEFVELGEAVRVGNIQQFNQIMDTYQSLFIQLGVFLVLEQVKILVYRNLFKHIYHLANTTRLNILIFEAALQSMGEEGDLDEIECILSNLIYQGRIKGYLNHEKRYLIVSKTDPFPTSAVIKKPE